MESIRYLALGDSYTIGTGLDDQSQCFPILLARHLTEETGFDVSVVNLGVNGYTTADLIREELPVARASSAELVTVLIGANDVVQGSDEAAYRGRLNQIYGAIQEFGLPMGRVAAISIPNFSALAGAASFGPTDLLRSRISAFNGLARSEAQRHQFGYIDITALHAAAEGLPGWLAADNLHPGPAQHRAIADHIWQAARGRWRAVMWDRWSIAAKRVLEVAAGEAETRRDSYIGTEHVLLSLLKIREGDAWELLTRRAISYPMVRRTLDKVLRPRGPEQRPSRIIPTTRVKHMTSLAGREASEQGAPSVEPEHILLALMVEGEGIAAHMLADLGATLADARANLERTRQGPPSS